MNDDELLSLIKSVDSKAVRVPPGVRKIVEAVVLAEREARALVFEDEDDAARARACFDPATAIRKRSNV